MFTRLRKTEKNMKRKSLWHFSTDLWSENSLGGGQINPSKLERTLLLAHVSCDQSKRFLIAGSSPLQDTSLPGGGSR